MLETNLILKVSAFFFSTRFTSTWIIFLNFSYAPFPCGLRDLAPSFITVLELLKSQPQIFLVGKLVKLSHVHFLRDVF